MFSFIKFIAISSSLLGPAICSPAKAQVPLVNCSKFSNPQAQARCIAQNQQTRNIYRNNQMLRYGYGVASGANKLGGYAAGKVAPDGGSTAYKAGNWLGNYWYTHPQQGRPLTPGPRMYPYQNVPSNTTTYRFGQSGR